MYIILSKTTANATEQTEGKQVKGLRRKKVNLATCVSFFNTIVLKGRILHDHEICLVQAVVRQNLFP